MSSLLNRAADQKRRDRLSFRLSLILSLFILIAAFKVSPDKVKAERMSEDNPEIINIEAEINTRQETEPPRPAPPPEPIISLSEEFEELEREETSLIQNAYVPPPPPLKEDRSVIIEEENEIFVTVEEFPEIIGGPQALTEKLYYTEIAKRIGIEGRVIVTVVVDKEGNVIDAQITKNLFDDLDQIALKAAKELKFKPGMQRGKPVKVKISIPINFKLR